MTLGVFPEAGQIYNPLKGALDETSIWNRALGADEIKAIVDTTTGTCATPTPSPSPSPTPSPSPSPAETPPAETPPATAPTPDTTAPETTITGGTPNGEEIKPGTPPARYTFSSDDPSARFECRAFDTVSREGFDTSRLFWTPCQSPYTSGLDTSTPSVYAFEVRAVDATGNKDATPAHHGMIHHADQTVPAVDRKPDKCKLVTVGKVQGSQRRLLAGCRLARIRKGRVPCMNVTTRQMRHCRFTRRSGAWVHSRSRRGPKFALVGEAVSLKGKRKGDWIVATKRGVVGKGATTVECAKPPAPMARKADTAGRVAEGMQLASICVVEDLGAEYNASSAVYGYMPLANYATKEVCSANHPYTHPHPDSDATVTRLFTGGSCYLGSGAAMNDVNGAERGPTGEYLSYDPRYPGRAYCHMIVSNGYEVPAAKRPATKSLPAPGVVNEKSVIAWRPVNPNVVIANDQTPQSPPPPIEPAVPQDNPY